MIDHLGKYYEWADSRIIVLMEKVGEELFVNKLKGTRRSLRDLVEHLIAYYEYFLFRKTNVSFKKLQEKLKTMEKQELLKHWQNIMKEFSEAVQNSREDFIDIPLPEGGTVNVSRDEYLFCFSDHATYHRGQLITTYKAVTRQKAAATDYYDFLLERLKK
jgi:uncharacterized damage-inducible protein DinB